MIVNVRASATLSPPAISGNVASVSSLSGKSSGGRAIRPSGMRFRSTGLSSLLKA